MATAKNTEYYVINTVAATAGDITQPSQGRVKVTGDTEGFLRRDVSSIVVKKFIVETLQVSTVTATATPAAGTTYQFIIEQEDANGKMQRLPIIYYATTGVTATILGTAITAGVQAYIDSGKLQATAVVITSGNGGVTVYSPYGIPCNSFSVSLSL
jgi:hypothetical protein